MHHELKQFTSHFQAIVDRKKTSIVRFDDRGYQVGDTVTLREGQYEGPDGFVYSGRCESARISFVDDYGLDSGYLNLSLSDVGLLITEDCKNEISR